MADPRVDLAKVDGYFFAGATRNLPELTGPAGAGRCLRKEGNVSAWILIENASASAPAAIDLFSISDRT